MHIFDFNNFYANLEMKVYVIYFELCVEIAIVNFNIFMNHELDLFIDYLYLY